MKSVNPYYVEELLGPLIGMGDDDEMVYSYMNLDTDSEQEIKAIISDLLMPNFFKFSKEKQEGCKRSLSYYLTTEKINFGNIYESCMLPFDHPHDPKLFFIWLWEVLFEDENFIMENPSQFVEKKDIYEPNRP